jgi:hypothetical protein
MKQSTMRVKAATARHPAARPSMPSLRLTALEVPAISRVAMVTKAAPPSTMTPGPSSIVPGRYVR